MIILVMVLGLTAGVVSSAAADTGDPTVVSASVEGLNLEVNWTAAAGEDVTGYRVTTQPESPSVVVMPNVRSTVMTGLRPNVQYLVSVGAIHANGPTVWVAGPQPVRLGAPGGSFIASGPQRVLDTRNGTGAPAGPATAVSLTIAGRGGVPAGNVSAVALNVTVTSTQNGGFVTVYPSGVDKPQVSNVNYLKGQSAANLVIVPIGQDGKVQLFSSAKTQLIADVEGYFTTAATASASSGLFSPVQPVRLMDTRIGLGASTPGPREKVRLKVIGTGGVPAVNVSAVVLNTTIAGSSSDGYLTAYPTGNPLPRASTINFAKGQVVANRTIVPVGPDGTVSFANSAGNTPVIVDVTGFFTADQDGSATGAYFAPVSPRRLVDTRRGLGAPVGPLGGGAILPVAVAGANGLPAASAATPANAAVTTVTFVHPSSVTFGTVYPSLSTRPVASDLNAAAGQDVPNLSLSGLGTDGNTAVFNARGTTDVLVDLSGYFIGSVHRPSSSVVLDSSQIAGVQGAPGGAQTVTLTGGAPSSVPGEIISVGVSSATPAGLSVRVLGVGVDDLGQQVLQTQPATLQEALGSADFSVTVPYDAADAVPAGSAVDPARVLGAHDLAERQFHPLATPVTQAEQKLSCAGDSTSFVETSYALTPTLTVEGHIGWSHFRPTVRTSTSAQVTGDAAADFAFSGKVGCSWNSVLSASDFPAVTFTIAGWPVVIVPRFTVKLMATLSGTAVFSSGVSQHLTTTAGLAYDSQDTTAIGRLSNTVSFSAPSTETAKGSATVAIEADVVGNFYGVAGSVTAINASLTATVDAAATSKWKLTSAVTAAATLDLRRSISDNTLSTATTVLFSKVLAQSNGLPAPTAAVMLTFGEYPASTFITTAYQSSGVLFAGQSQMPYLAEDPPNPTSPALAGGGPTTFGDPIYGSFTNPDGSPRSVTSFALDLGYLDQAGSAEVLAYSTSGALLATVRAKSIGMNRISITATDIRSFVVRSTGVSSPSWAIDNLNFQGFAG